MNWWYRIAAVSCWTLLCTTVAEAWLYTTLMGILGPRSGFGTVKQSSQTLFLPPGSAIVLSFFVSPLAFCVTGTDLLMKLYNNKLHAFNLSTWEGEAGGSLSSRPPSSTERVLGQQGLHSETLSYKTKQKRNYIVMGHSWVIAKRWTHYLMYHWSVDIQTKTAACAASC